MSTLRNAVMGLTALTAPLAACAADSDATDAMVANEAVIAEVSTDEPDDNVALFSEVLAQHQALNTRVERVGHSLLTANADLCAATRRTTGLSVHTLSDYPDALQPLAMNMLDVGEGVSIRSVVEGGPADLAGVEPGDRVRAVGGMPIADNMTAIRYWEIANDRIRDARDVDYGLTRQGRDVSVTLDMETACDVDVLVQFSEEPNAYTDGREVVITSELVRRSPSDSRLALVLAHELAHVIAHADVFTGEIDGGRDLEFDADAKGLLLMARSGFDMDAAIADMEAFSEGVISGDGPTHPAHTRRVETLKGLRADVRSLLASGEDVTLDMIGADSDAN